jgi:hypothetical protein
MKEVSSELRKAVIEAITPLTVAGVTIPVRDTFFPPTANPATYQNGQCYVLITDQDEAETTNNDCSTRQNVRLTIDIVTKFPTGNGGKKASEDISNAIQQAVILGSINLPADWQILNIRKDFSRTIIEQGSTQVAYRKLISYTFDVFEV